MDISVLNSSVDDKRRVKPKHGLDFAGWDDIWLSMYKVSVSANEQEYPLLIEPQ